MRLADSYTAAMSDEQPPIAPEEQPPPPPEHGPFAAAPTWAPPPDAQPQLGWQRTGGGFYPLTIGRVFELTFSLYRNRWRTLVGIALVLEVLTTLASLLVLVGPQSSFIGDFTPGTVPSPDVVNAMLASLAPTFALSFVAFVVFLAVGFVEFGAMTDAIGRIYAGKPVSAVSSLRRGLRRWISFIALMLLLAGGALAILFIGLLLGTLVVAVVSLALRSTPLAVFLVLIAYVGTIAAMIFGLVRWSMAPQVVMLESLGARAAMGRSWRLIAGSTWRVIGYYLAFWLLVLLASLVVGTIVSLVVNPYQMSGFTIVSYDPAKLAISSVLSSLLAAFLAPITTIPAVLLYFDLRVRKGDFINPPGQGALTAYGRDGSVAE